MTQRKKLILGGLLAALLLILMPLAIFAQGNPPAPDASRGLLRALTDAAAQVLNMEPQDFVQALREGKTPAQLAQEAGVPQADLAAALQAAWNAEGETLIARFIENGPPKPRHRTGPRARFQHARLWVKVSAQTLDMPLRDFLQAMREGQTPAQIAEARGGSGQALLDAIVRVEKERLDKAVAEGKLAQDRADAILSRLTDKAGHWVEKGFPKPAHPRP